MADGRPGSLPQPCSCRADPGEWGPYQSCLRAPTGCKLSRAAPSLFVCAPHRAGTQRGREGRSIQNGFGLYVTSGVLAFSICKVGYCGRHV